MKKLYFLAAAAFSVMLFSIQTTTAAGPLDLTGVDNFVILANTYTNSGTGTVLNGDLGYTVAPANPPTVAGTTFASPNPVYVSAMTKQASLLASANNPSQSGACTTTLGVATVLDTLSPLAPGVYCITGAASINSGIVLDGDGTYIFRISGTLDALDFSQVSLAGNAKADNVFWVPAGGTTLGDDSIFAGIILSNAAITLGSTVVMDGRILSNGAVTTTGFFDTITAPLVTIAPPLDIVDVTSRSDCDDCIPPTLGLDSNNFRRVDLGFSYNGHSSNVGPFLTPLTLRTTEVGAVNKAVFKIFEEDAPDEVRHFDLIFGLAKGQVLGDSKVMIELYRSWDEINTVNVIDPEHALKDVRVETSEGPCRADAVFKNDCLIVTVYHTFRTPLEFNIMATNVWDEHRNARQNYFTPGVKVVESITEPEPELEIPGLAVNVTNDDAYKVLISDLNVTKSQVVVGEIIRLSFRITDGIGNIIPWITPDVGICKESATKPHYLFVKPKSVLAQDIDCPFFHSDFISSSDRFNISMVIPEGIPEGKYKLDVWADPDYINDGRFVGDHQSIDITVISAEAVPVSTGDLIESPLKQFKAGITLDKIQCKENLHLVIKTSNENPVCVKPETKIKLIERGWAKPQT
ncbi:ice-binding family protein [Candidatus Nitrosotenuis chungbukensis]|uniref:ice-binding family protein n=1 Tax=Candidatus Nitrosotenuis chungbukensis TaxID=1353246 RepID=UPI0006944F22|nr:ice-binding family protein [Candidatus Nitrosotenuis chungbukensis]